MAPPSKRPPQGRKPSQGKRSPQGKGASSARTSAATSGAHGDTAAKAPVAASSAETNSIAEERKAKREAARQERIAIARRKQKAKRQKQSLISAILVLGLLGAIFYGVNKSRNEGKAAAQAASAAGCTGVQEVENEGRDHKPVTEELSADVYKSNPPTSGPHYAERVANWGSYNEETPATTLVHNLEHGGIVIHYKDQSDDQIDTIASFVDGYVDGVISNPNPNIETPIAIASWDSKQGCKTFSADAVAGYIREHCNKGPEKLTTCRS